MSVATIVAKPPAISSRSSAAEAGPGSKVASSASKSTERGMGTKTLTQLLVGHQQDGLEILLRNRRENRPQPNTCGVQILELGERPHGDAGNRLQPRQIHRAHDEQHALWRFEKVERHALVV